MPYLTPDAIDPIEILRVVRVSVEPRLLGALSGAISELTNWGRWEKSGAMTPEEVIAYFAVVFEDYLKSDMLGLIFPYASASPPPWSLACDGSTHNRVDFPRLYALLDPIFHIDPDTFKTPDLRGRTVIAAGQGAGLTNRAVGALGGVETHVLTVAEMPSHTHSALPHAHTEIGVIPAPGALAPGAPVAYAIAQATFTGSSGLTIENTGGDGPHENMPPFFALKYCMVAY